MCVLKHTHLTVYSNFFLFLLCLRVCCSAVKKKTKPALLGSVSPSRIKRGRQSRSLLLRASLLPCIVVVLLFVAVCCQGFPPLFVCRRSVPLCTVKLQSVTVFLSCVLPCDCSYRSFAAVCFLCLCSLLLCLCVTVSQPASLLMCQFCCMRRGRRSFCKKCCI